VNKVHSIRFQLGILNDSDADEDKEKRYNYLELLQHLEDEILDISHELRIDFVDVPFNFCDMMNDLIAQRNEQKMTNFRIQIDENIDWTIVSGLDKLTLYRITQESMQNVIKYAKAKGCFVSVFLQKNKDLQLTITDDGIGFSLENSEGGGIGLKNMKDRAASCRAKFSVSSELGKGTTTKVVFDAAELKKNQASIS
jgi:nitrate/nitrite-specific signal transduction histidine kinase